MVGEIEMTDTQPPQTGQDSDECPCHVSREELEAATASLERCLAFATAPETANATLQNLLTDAIANNQGSVCPPVVLEARGPHIVPPSLEDCPCHVSPDEVEDANRSLERCQEFANSLAVTGDTTLRDLLIAALRNNGDGSVCPPVVLRARGPH
jgi:hypothetical protein